MSVAHGVQPGFVMVLHDHRPRWLEISLVLGVAGGCAISQHVVHLLDAGVPVVRPATSTLEVFTRSTAVPDPLPVRGADVAYTDTEAALYRAVVSATAPWAESHASPATGGGWQLLVELTSADADYSDDRVVFTLGVRATLRTRAGNEFLAQTQVACRQGGVVPPEGGARVMDRCLTEVGRQLGNWLDGVNLDAVGPSVAQ